MIIFCYWYPHFTSTFKISVRFLCDNSFQAISPINYCLKDFMSEATGWFLNPALVIFLHLWSQLLSYVLKHFVSP